MRASRNTASTDGISSSAADPSPRADSATHVSPRNSATLVTAVADSIASSQTAAPRSATDPGRLEANR